MATSLTPGARFRKALVKNKPLQILGTINPNWRNDGPSRLPHKTILPVLGGGVCQCPPTALPQFWV